MRAEWAAGIRKIIGGDGALPSNKTVVCRVSTKHAGCIHSLALADTNARFATRYSMVATVTQFSAECRPPAPARTSTLVRLGFWGWGCEQFHRHAPQ